MKPLAFLFAFALALSSLSSNASAGETTQKILRGSAEVETETLSFYVVNDPACPFTHAQLDSAVASELLEAEIRKTHKWEDVVLAVSVSCKKLSGKKGVIFSYKSSFCATSATLHGSDSDLTMCDPYPEAGLGMVKSSKSATILKQAMKSVRKSLEEFQTAVTESK